MQTKQLYCDCAVPEIFTARETNIGERTSTILHIESVFYGRLNVFLHFFLKKVIYCGKRMTQRYVALNDL